MSELICNKTINLTKIENVIKNLNAILLRVVCCPSSRRCFCSRRPRRRVNASHIWYVVQATVEWKQIQKALWVNLKGTLWVNKSLKPTFIIILRVYICTHTFRHINISSILMSIHA